MVNQVKTVMYTVYQILVNNPIELQRITDSSTVADPEGVQSEPPSHTPHF